MYLLAGLRANGIIPGVVIIVVKCTLDNLRGLFYEAQEFWGDKDIGSLLLSEF